MGRYIDLTGLRFGRWVVLFKNNKKSRKTLWVCKCDCGTVRAVDGWALQSGKSKSCGCLGNEHRIASTRTHNETSTRLHRIWQAMRGRCKNPNNAEYYLYGGRGISVCDEWGDYLVFRDWAMSNGYSDTLTIDRIDNNGNYEPSNCRWATSLVQGNNKRTCVYITFNGETLTIAEWARKIGMQHETLRCRIVKRKWSIERALTTPVLVEYRR